MKKTRQMFVFTVLFIPLSVFAGRDVDNALEQVNNSVALGLNFFNLDYKEIFFDLDRDSFGNLPKSTESGIIYGAVFDTRITFLKAIYTNLYLDYFNDKLRYDGTEQRPPHEPIVAKFRHRFFNSNLKFGPVIAFAEEASFQVIPYVGAGYRYWCRQNDTDDPEKYHHYKALAGLKLNWLVTDNLILSPYFEGGKIFNVYMKCIPRGYSWKLGKHPVYEAGLEANYRAFDEIFLNGFVSYSQFEYGRSNRVGERPPFEPDSKTYEIKFGLAMRYSWLIE